tara:strand:+ start:23 stop:880 length:858 start_codon:yes stop_codon:yes gene_type:complete
MLISYIPNQALKFGAESLNKFPVRYGKSKISGSLKTTYIMHSKSGCMPGQPSRFIDNSKTKPGLGKAINKNRITEAFKNENIVKSKVINGIHYPNKHLDYFSYDEFHPNDDQSLDLSIKAAYRQVYGNFNCFESERPIELERRLRNGDITIREFIRKLAKSSFYKKHYFEKINQQRSIELNFKHILGRPPFNQKEVRASISLIHQLGFNQHIDYLVDSREYLTLFGEHTVPFMRCWNSSTGIRTSSFINSYRLIKSFATSDNLDHSKHLEDQPIYGQSILVNQLG